jgi:putative endonuclease
MYFVYILKNPKGVLYKGQTDDLEKRIKQHNDPVDSFPSFTKKRGPWTLVYKEKYPTRDEARQRERFLKSGKGRDF